MDDKQSAGDLVSIVTPAYNAERFVQKTIDSVKNQSYQKWELLIADDCSSDRTREIVAGESECDARIKLIKCDKNGGPAAARNAAISAARGRWLAFLDSDDWWLPEKLTKSIDHANAKRAALVYTGFRRVSWDGDTVGRQVEVPGSLSYRQLLGHTAIATSTVLIDRSLVGNVQMQPVFYDDFVCWLGILKNGHLAYGLNEDLMRYRVVQNSVSRNKWRSAREVWKTYRRIEELGLLMSIWCFASYSARAFFKYSKF